MSYRPSIYFRVLHLHRTLTSASNTDAFPPKSKILAEINGNPVRPDKDVVSTEEITGERLRQRLDEALRAGQGGGKAGAQHTKVGEEGDAHDVAARRQP